MREWNHVKKDKERREENHRKKGEREGEAENYHTEKEENRTITKKGTPTGTC